jgi:CrcB protein
MVSDTMKLAVAVGFVGAYTTFSTFMYESNSLMKSMESGSGVKAMVNLIGSVVIGLLAVRAGIWMGNR